MTSEDKDQSLSSSKSAFRAAVGLGLFAILTAGLIAIVKVSTQERIIEQEAQARLASLYALVPKSYRDNDLLSDSYPLTIGGQKSEKQVYLARKGGTIQAIVLPWTAPEGYTAPIQLLVAIKTDGTLLGVRVVSHRETPGLGDKIELGKSEWIRGFDGRSTENPEPAGWKVKKDGGAFDQLTGATITPRAVVSAVYQALRFYQLNQVQLLNNPAQTSLKLSGEEFEKY